MRTRTKVWLIIAASLVLIGSILFVHVMTTLQWDFMKLATVEYETNIYEISETFDDISVNTGTADIAFMLSDDGICRVECHEEANAKHSVTVEDGTLAVELTDKKSAYNFNVYIGLNFGSPKITVYLPKTEYDDVTIRVSTGKTYLTDIVCKNVILSGSTGDIYLNNVIAEEKFSVERSTGDVKFDGSDAAEIFVSTDTGDVTGSLLSGKEFITQTDTGVMDVPKTVDGGRCEIVTDTGDIRITIKQ